MMIPDETETASVEGLYEAVRRAALDAAPPGACEPAAGGAGSAVLTGPHGARLTVTARTARSGALTGAAWRGRGADGAAVHGHGRPSAALAAAARWAAGLDRTPAITPLAIRARRGALGLSQAELAALLGMGQPTLAQWETGVRSPRDPEGVARALADLEDRAEAIAAAAAREGAGALTTYARDADWWAADPDAAAERIPAAVHRAATARAAARLRRAGREPVITDEPAH